jgi:chromate transporter
LFVIFFKSGCAFGGGPGILAALDRELVDRRGAVSREDLLATYTLGRVVPSGTMTAVAIAYGHRFAGFPGTLAALAGLLLPGVSLTLLLIIGYAALGDSPVLPILAATVLPAALAFIVAAICRFGQTVWRWSIEPLLALGALGGVVFFGLHPVVILLACGILGVVGCREERRP